MPTSYQCRRGCAQVALAARMAKTIHPHLQLQGTTVSYPHISQSLLQLISGSGIESEQPSFEAIESLLEDMAAGKRNIDLHASRPYPTSTFSLSTKSLIPDKINSQKTQTVYAESEAVNELDNTALANGNSNADLGSATPPWPLPPQLSHGISCGSPFSSSVYSERSSSTACIATGEQHDLSTPETQVRCAKSFPLCW